MRDRRSGTDGMKPRGWGRRAEAVGLRQSGPGRWTYTAGLRQSNAADRSKPSDSSSRTGRGQSGNMAVGGKGQSE
jgi:hypothetical protein